MPAMWSCIAFLVGIFVGYLIIRPRLQRCEAELSSERSRSGDLDQARQKLEVEVCTLRAAAQQVEQTSSDLVIARSSILELTEKCSTSAATVDLAEKRIGELKNQLEAKSNDLEATRSKLTQAEVSSAELSSKISERELALKQERAQLEQMRLGLRTQFAELSLEVLQKNSETFLENAKRVLELEQREARNDLHARREEIKSLLKPIENGISAVSNAALEMEKARATAFGSIEQRLEQAVTSAAEVAKQASALKDALKRPNVRGRWGEVQLEICVELAGMEEHCDVEFQQTSLSADDELLRPDMIVRMPGGRKIAVDAKTPMTHFLTYIEASTDDDRQTAVINHGRALKKHIDNLAKTDYMQKIAESPDFVVMFLPNESFLAMGLEKEPNLMEDALRRKVLIATPGTLIGLLRVIQYGWNEQRIAQNAQRIAEEGSKLNGEISKFLADFAKLGDAIESVNQAFGSSKRRVENKIARTSVTLTSLGATSGVPRSKSKKIAARVSSMLKNAGGDDDATAEFVDGEELAFGASSDDLVPAD